MRVRKKKEKAVATDVPKVAEQWPKVYVGPSIRGSFLTPNKVFANGYPVPVRQLLEEHPDLRFLFVPVSKMRKALAEVATRGTLLNSIFNQTLKQIELGGLNV